MRAAIIENGVVTNIIMISGPFRNAVPTGDLPVAIGDTYDGKDFWRNGEKVAIPQPDSELEEVIDILTGEGESI